MIGGYWVEMSVGLSVGWWLCRSADAWSRWAPYIDICICTYKLFANLQMPGKGGKNAGFIAEIEAKEKMVKMQLELEKAKVQLYKIRKERAKR